MIVTCPKCGKNIFLDNIENEKSTIYCKKCDSRFSIENLVSNVNDNKTKTLHNKYWFYKYNNGDVRIGISIQNIKIAIFLFFVYIIQAMFLSYILHNIYDDISIIMVLVFIGLIIVPIPYVVFFLVGTALFGKFEFYINNKESYSFKGFFKFGLKKRFLWNEIKDIFYKENDFFGLPRERICLHGKKLIEIGIGFAWIKKDEILFLISALNYFNKKGIK
jgi:DNA-directed RNA polymerase subunit RPC12/RpoP